MTTTTYVVFQQVSDDDMNKWKSLGEITSRDPQRAIDAKVLEFGGEETLFYFAVPKKFVRPVPRHVETVKTVVGGA